MSGGSVADDRLHRLVLVRIELLAGRVDLADLRLARTPRSAHFSVSSAPALQRVDRHRRVGGYRLLERILDRRAGSSAKLPRRRTYAHVPRPPGPWRADVLDLGARAQPRVLHFGRLRRGAFCSGSSRAVRGSRCTARIASRGQRLVERACRSGGSGAFIVVGVPGRTTDRGADEAASGRFQRQTAISRRNRGNSAMRCGRQCPGLPSANCTGRKQPERSFRPAPSAWRAASVASRSAGPGRRVAASPAGSATTRSASAAIQQRDARSGRE